VKHLESFAKPAVIAVLICAFLYVYYQGSDIFSLVRPPLGPPSRRRKGNGRGKCRQGNRNPLRFP